MGYRLTVECVGEKEPKYYGTKLYGYCEEKELSSYKWLIKNGYLDKDKYYCWSYCCQNPILMEIGAFREFVELYNNDLNQKYQELEKDDFKNDEDIKKFLEKSDWELVVLSWG